MHFVYFYTAPFKWVQFSAFTQSVHVREKKLHISKFEVYMLKLFPNILSDVGTYLHFKTSIILELKF